MIRIKDARAAMGFQITHTPEKWPTAPQGFELHIELNEGRYAGYAYGAPVEVVRVPADNYRLLQAVGRRAIDPEYYGNMIRDYNDFVVNGPPSDAVSFETLFED